MANKILLKEAFDVLLGIAQGFGLEGRKFWMELQDSESSYYHGEICIRMREAKTGFSYYSILTADTLGDHATKRIVAGIIGNWKANERELKSEESKCTT